VIPSVPWAPGPLGPLLKTTEVHVWVLVLGDRVTDRPSANRLWALLSADEQVRANSFHFAADRWRFVTVRGVLRLLIGRYLELPPDTIRFTYSPRGKPTLGPAGLGPDGLRFSVSYSGGVALLSFARGRDLGVDVERERRVPEAEAIARRHFSALEIAALGQLPRDERNAAFLRCWTRKEAFIKMTGDGLSLPLNTFAVTLLPTEPARIVRVEGYPDGPSRWWLDDLNPAPGFAAALSVEGKPTKIVCWRYEFIDEQHDESIRSETRG
jgi:4'-phosphopantetheinyl transferase